MLECVNQHICQFRELDYEKISESRRETLRQESLYQLERCAPTYDFFCYLYIVKQEAINIKNKRARFDFLIKDNYTAGIQLTGTEIKAIRAGKAHINEAFCQIRKGELFVVNMHIAEYTFGTHYNHVPNQPRKLLLKKQELKQIQRKIIEKGMTVIPVRLFLSERGLAKLDIATAVGKKSFDKRNSIKEKDTKRDLDRIKNRY